MRVALVVSTNTLDTDEVVTFGENTLGNVPEISVALVQVITESDGGNDTSAVSFTG